MAPRLGDRRVDVHLRATISCARQGGGQFGSGKVRGYCSRIVDDRCAHLDFEGRLEFDYHTQQLHELLRRAVDPGLLGAVQEGAAQAAQQYECGDKTQGMTQAMAALARDTYFQITHVPYGKEIKAIGEANRLMTFMAHQKLDDKCRFLPDDDRREYDRHLGELTQLFGKRAGKDRAASVQTQAAAIELSPNTVCGAALRERLTLMLRRLRRIAESPN